MANEIDQLLAAHAAAWWRDIEALDFVERVNATYAAYLAGGGTDAHYGANWRAMSDAAKSALDWEFAHAPETEPDEECPYENDADDDYEDAVIASQDGAFRTV